MIKKMKIIKNQNLLSMIYSKLKRNGKNKSTKGVLTTHTRNLSQPWGGSSMPWSAPKKKMNFKQNTVNSGPVELFSLLFSLICGTGSVLSYWTQWESASSMKWRSKSMNIRRKSIVLKIWILKTSEKRKSSISNTL